MSLYTPELHLQLSRERLTASAGQQLTVRLLRSQRSRARAVSATRRAQRLTASVQPV